MMQNRLFALPAGILIFAFCTFGFVFAAAATPGDITTVAGKGVGDGGTASEADLANPYSVFMDASGNLYIADISQSRIRKVDVSGNITTVAGNGTRGFSGDGGPATDASLNLPWDTVVDGEGNVYISERISNRIRKVDTSGIITTVAGGNIGDGRPATERNFYFPTDVFVDGEGNIYIADSDNYRIRKVDSSGNIITIAGNGESGFSGDGGPATDAGLRSQAVFGDGAGALYITDGNRIRKVDPSGTIFTIAGNGENGFSGDGGPATDASLRSPERISLDDEGNLYIADRRNYRIRKVDSSGTISTVAGNGTRGFSGDGGPATEANLNDPRGVSADGLGNIYIADTRNNRIRKVDVSGIITTVAGDSTSGFNGDAGLATETWLSSPGGVFADASGNIYFADTGNDRLRKVDPSGNITTVAGGAGFDAPIGDGGPATQASLNFPQSVHVDGAGNIYTVGRNRVRKVDPSGTISTVAGGDVGDGRPATETNLRTPYGISVDGGGNLYIADFSNYLIRKVDPSGTISTVAGDGGFAFTVEEGLATDVSLNNPVDVFADGSGNLYIVEGGRIRKVDASGAISTIAGGGSVSAADGGLATEARIRIPQSVHVDGAGNIYIVDRSDNRAWKVDPSGVLSLVAGNGGRELSGDGGPASEASLQFPRDVFVDGAGNIYIADTGSDRIRKVDPSGIISTAIGGYIGDGVPATEANIRNPSGIVLDGAGNLYITDIVNQRIRKVDPAGTISTIAGGGLTSPGEGGPATEASLNLPYDISMDGTGNIYIADRNNHRIRKVNLSGIISTVAGNGERGFSSDDSLATDTSLSSPSGVFVDGAGNIYIADASNNRIRKVTPSGIISTVAGNGERDFSGDGGPATDASLNFPFGVATDGNGNIYIADRSNNRIRKVDASGTISTVAGNGERDFSGDGGPATSAGLDLPWGIAVDGEGILYIADELNDRVRKVDSSGIISTVAGNGIRDFSGDGGPATNASLNLPAGLSIDGAGNLYITEVGSDRVRRVETIASAVSLPTPGLPGDFDGNGVVNFDDFVEFAQNFGTSQGQPNYDARFDLDGSNDIGFNDFVIFAQNFGKTA